MKNLFQIFAFLSIVVFSGCFSKEPKPKELEIAYPNWFDNQPKDNSRFIYGIGESISKKDAIAQALNSISSRISVQVESTYKSKTVLKGSEYSRDISLDIKQSLKKIEFTNYKVLNNHRISRRNLVLVQVDRIQTAKSLKSKINRNLQNLKNTLFSKYNSRVAKLKSCISVKNKISSIDSEILILNSINPKSKNSSLFNKVTEINDISNKFISKINFNIIGGGEYGKILTKLIGEKGFSISKRRNSIKIEIKLKKEKLSVLGNFITKFKIEISVTDNNLIISKDIFTTGGKSISSYSQADEFAVREFELKSRKDNLLLKLIGI